MYPVTLLQLRQFSLDFYVRSADDFPTDVKNKSHVSCCEKAAFPQKMFKQCSPNKLLQLTNALFGCMALRLEIL
jgi:hypothetical protein